VIGRTSTNKQRLNRLSERGCRKQKDQEIETNCTHAVQITLYATFITQLQAYKLDDRCSIPGTKFFSSPMRPDRLWGHPAS